MMPPIWITVLILAAMMHASHQDRPYKSLEAVNEGNNKFTIDFYQALKNESGNIICSPISADIVLALAYHGAVGATAEEMAKVLHLPASKNVLLEGHKDLITRLQDPVLKLATRFFIERQFHLKPSYKSDANTYFLTDVELKNFGGEPESARKEINVWVEEKTNNKITDLLPGGTVDSTTRLVLVNAIHFKADWEKKFDEADTKMEPFHITPTETVNVPMLNLRDEIFLYRFSDKLNAKICELPYKGNKFSMILIVPEKLDGLSDVESKLGKINLMEEIHDLEKTSVNLKLPKFKIEKEMELSGILQGLGMKSAFTPAANFSGITDEPLYISKVIQKAFVEVNEKGTEAAAATGLEMVPVSAVYYEEPINVVCDRPFLFLIKEHSTIVFISRVSEFKK